VPSTLKRADAICKILRQDGAGPPLLPPLLPRFLERRLQVRAGAEIDQHPLLNFARHELAIGF
jgi:hypothetical protein